MKTIELSNGQKVNIIDKITWGMQEQIRAAMLGGIRMSGVSDKEKKEISRDIEFNGEALLRGKYKTMELCISGILEKDGTETKYSKDWIDNLSVSDGDTLYTTINDLTNL